MSAQVKADQFLDPIWRLSNLYMIVDKEGNAVPFRPNWAQLELLENFHSRNLILKARQLGMCLDPDTRVLTADLTWERISELRPGTEIVSVDEYPTKPGRGQARRMRTAAVVAAVQVYHPAYRITFDDGRSLVCTAKHPWLSKKAGSGCAWRTIQGGDDPRGRKSRLRVGDKIRWITKPWGDSGVEDGWFGGMLDGEGSIAKANSRASINVSQRSGPVWDRLVRYVAARGYNYCIEGDEKRASKFGRVPVLKLVVGRMDEMFRLIGQTRPTRFLDNRFWEGRELPGKKVGGVGWATIVGIEPVGERTLIDLQTTEGTYIAEGFVSHNTTLMCLVQLDDCVFTPNTRAALIAHKLDDAKRIFRDKVKYPYEQLDEGIRNAVPLTTDSADTLTLANNSSFLVSTSARSGTLNWLHVSEYGKICAQFPEKAREIRTGSFPAAENGNITIESTAEGEEGDFFDRCRKAQELENAGTQLTRRDPKFFFFPWWREPMYRQRQSTAPCSPDDERYFARIEAETGTKLDQEQKNWWLAQERELGGDMKREYPATPEEAFEQALEGAIFADDLAVATKHRRIGNFPLDPTRPVNTFWDLGHFDETAIWLEQDFGDRPTFVGYYENSGEGIEHYIQWLEDFRKEYKITWGRHCLPHDGDRKTIWTPEGSMVVMGRLNFRPDIITRTPDKAEAVRMGKRAMARCAFDVDGCKEGLARLKRYRKEWDEKRGVWKDKPHHGPESNGADAFLTFAQSNHRPLAPLTQKRDAYRDNDEPDTEDSWMTV